MTLALSGRSLQHGGWYTWGQGLSEMSPTFLPALRAPVAPLQNVGTLTGRRHLCHLDTVWPLEAVGARAVVITATWVPSMSLRWLLLGRGGSVEQPPLRVGRECGAVKTHLSSRFSPCKGHRPSLPFVADL